ncbi:hypothetical protein [Mesorhizobium sp. IMUNJ 23232]|uniref:hypothetical protein n=1 Tax=Mesorhizobium sp. IMUNJ 23232 TaxID=3376064 RepID=UPI0037B5CCD7
MIVRPILRFLAKYGLGYCIAVVVASMISATIAVVQEDGVEFADFLMVGFIAMEMAFLTAWPGFILINFLALVLHRRAPLMFAIAGGATALAAIGLLLGEWSLSLSATAGGFAGGYAYGRFSLSRLFVPPKENTLGELKETFS